MLTKKKTITLQTHSLLPGATLAISPTDIIFMGSTSCNGVKLFLVISSNY